MSALLEVEGLTTRFPGPNGGVPIVDGSSFTIDRGEVLALVGSRAAGSR